MTHAPTETASAKTLHPKARKWIDEEYMPFIDARWVDSASGRKFENHGPASDKLPVTCASSVRVLDPGISKLVIVTLALLCPSTTTLSAETFSADVWADNWFEMRVNGKQVAEDSVPITTERSFNAESFEFEADRPFIIGLVAKDFKENDSGLEYIGTRRQQMGDGGVIVQIQDASGKTVAVSNAAWQCLVIHTAPLNKSCEREANPVAGEGACAFEAMEEPGGWDLAGFDSSDWPQARIYSEREVSPKDGYDRIDWVDEAVLIWGPDLEQSNTILCRLTVE